MDHNLHRLRRQALNPFFSKAAVSKLEPVIQAHVDHLVERLHDAAGICRPVSLSDAFTALSADVIGSYAFGSSYNLLDHKDFEPGWRKFMTVSTMYAFCANAHDLLSRSVLTLF